jgi:hypothetical protein
MEDNATNSYRNPKDKLRDLASNFLGDYKAIVSKELR